MQLKAISSQEYKNLRNLIPRVAKLQDTINKMATVIKSKDSQLEELQRLHRMNLAKCINVSNLSAVSIPLASFFFLDKSLYFLEIKKDFI